MFSPDGSRVVTASDDKTARIWDARDPALDVQIGWAEAALLDPLPSTERFELGLPAATDVRQWPVDQSKCDQAAAAPYDPDRRAPGVMFDQIVTHIAVAACAIDKTRSDNRATVYQHGRSLMAGLNYAAARQDFEAALARGYRGAGVDLAMLLAQPSAGMLDVPNAIARYEQAWNNGVRIAAFELGKLYEHGVSLAGDRNEVLAPDITRAWSWYKKAADAGEPNALARFAESTDSAAVSEEDAAKKNSYLLESFKHYAAAAERARSADWPDDAWRNWRYHRASLARLLAREGMMEDVAGVYDSVRKQYVP